MKLDEEHDDLGLITRLKMYRLLISTLFVEGLLSKTKET